MEEPLEVAQETVRVGQAFVQEVVFLAWEVLVSGKEGQCGGESAVKEQQMWESSLCNFCCSRFRILRVVIILGKFLHFRSFLRGFPTYHPKHHGLKRSQLLHVLP